jgi:hypothetical protein
MLSPCCTVDLRGLIVGFPCPLVVEVVVSTVKLLAAGLESVFPAASVARASKVWVPKARPVYDFGDEHPDQLEPSRRHSKLEPASEEPLPKSAEVDVMVPEGPEVIVVSGGVVSAVGAELPRSSNLPRRAPRVTEVTALPARSVQVESLGSGTVTVAAPGWLTSTVPEAKSRRMRPFHLYRATAGAPRSVFQPGHQLPGSACKSDAILSARSFTR